jgi:hypothetical protein
MEIDFANKIDAELHRQVKAVSSQRGINLKTAVDAALRAWLDPKYVDKDTELGRKVRAAIEGLPSTGELQGVRQGVLSMLGLTEEDL